jgi:EpsI family protein
MIDPVDLPHPLADLPVTLGAWSQVGDGALSPAEIELLKPTSSLMRTYAGEQSRASILMAYFARQKPGETIHSPKNCIPSSWTPVSASIQTIESGGEKFPVNVYRIANENDRRLLLYWYQSPRRIVASEYGVKLYLIQDSLLARRSDGLLARIEISEQDPQALEHARHLAADLIPAIQNLLRR